MVLWSPFAIVALAFSPPAEPVCAAALSDSDFSRAMNGEERRLVIERLSHMVEQLYVDPAKGRFLKESLHRNLAAGRYDRSNDASVFASSVTEDMRSVVPDKHLKLRLQRIEPSAPSAGQDTPDAKAGRLERFRRGAAYDGYGIREVKVLPGNIGYLSLGEFWTPKVASSAFDGAMAVLKDSDALIIDLRGSYGGSEEAVTYLAGYLLSDPTTLFTSVDHLSRETRTERSMPRIAEARLRPDIKVYILTSKRKTFSAAEMMALALQRKRGAIIVGEQTRGGANGGDFRPLTCRFDAFIPYFSSTVDGINWEGVGIAPDIATSEADALDTAYRKALEVLIEKPLPDNADGLTREIKDERGELLETVPASPQG